MPSLKLSNPFRRSADRPTMKDRAAALRETAGHVMGGNYSDASAEAVARMAPHHPGFVPYSHAAPTHLIAVDLMIRTEARRLLDAAHAEFERLHEAQTQGKDRAQSEAVEERLRGDLRMRALAEAAAEENPAEVVDWHNPPAGFMAHPANEPGGFLKIAAALPLEAERLHGVAEAEFERRCKSLQGYIYGTDYTARVTDLRRTLRLDAWAAVASPERAEAAGDDRSQPGFVLYEDAAGTARRGSVAEWVGFMARRLYSVAKGELDRGFNAACASEADQDTNALYDRLRCEMRIDALFDLAYHSREVFEASRGYAIGARRRYDHSNADLIALGVEFEAALIEATAANAACDEAATRALPFPQPPACLTFRETDHPFGLRRMSCHPSALEGQPVLHDDVAWMRRGPRQHQVLRDARPGEHGWRDYGGKVPEMQPWPEAQARADEILTAWDAWQTAQVAHNAVHGVIEAEARADAAHAKVGAFLDQMTALPARTAEGLCVKLRTMRFGIESLGDHQTGRFLRALVQDASDMQARPLGTTSAPAAASFAAPAYDLSSCTLPQLARLYETWEGVFHHLTAACSAPCFTDNDHTGLTPAGEVLDQEYDRAGEFLSVIEREARKRVPESPADRNERLNVLVRHEMNCNGRPADASLLAELNAAEEA